VVLYHVYDLWIHYSLPSLILICGVVEGENNFPSANKSVSLLRDIYFHVSRLKGSRHFTLL
jgi:hypothetical protein